MTITSIVINTPPNNLLTSAKFLARLTTGLFAGGNLYCSMVEHPARMDVSTRIAATIFPSSITRGALLQITLSATAVASSIYAYTKEQDKKWLAAGLLSLAVLPYTYMVITPVVEKLTDPNLDIENIHTADLLNRWGAFHSVRTLMSLTAFVLVNLIDTL